MSLRTVRVVTPSRSASSGPVHRGRDWSSASSRSSRSEVANMPTSLAPDAERDVPHRPTHGGRRAWQTRAAMPLDVPTYSFALPDGVDPPAVRALLATRFDVVPEGAAPLSFTVVDTADRRVRAAGADLVLEPGRPAPELVLRPAPGASAVRGGVGRRTRRWTIGDLPAGPLRDHLAPIVEMRALLPLAQVRVDVQGLRVRNDDEKTVVRLRGATHAALDTGGQPVALAPRLEVTGVLGSPKPLARVVQVLTTEARLVDAPASVADEAIAAAGGDPTG